MAEKQGSEMIDAMIDFMLWEGVAIVAWSVILALGYVRYEDGLSAILLAACIPAANFVIEAGYFFYWWDHQGFMSFTMMFVMVVVLILLFILWIGMDTA